MATRIELYYCNICKESYTTLAKAEECERIHKEIVEVKNPVYLKKDQNKSYPNSVILKFSNGAEVRYHRKKEVL